MKIGFVGLGKLGLPCALAVESKGHDVCGTDVSEKVREIVASRKIPYMEAGAQTLLEKSKLQWCDSVAGVVEESDIVFLAVQTPHDPRFEGITILPDERRDFDYTYLVQAADAVACAAKLLQKRTILTVISTVLPGTVDKYIKPILNEWTTLCYNPFFIAMSTCIRDFLYPEFVLLGVDDPEAAKVVEGFYATITDAPVERMSVRSAELCKVSYNTFITAKITIANTIMEVAHKTGADCDEVMRALKKGTRRITSSAYMDGGHGDSGGCLPAGEKVFTPDGPKNIEDIQEGDLVLSAGGKFRPVKKRWERDYDGDIVTVSVEGTPPARFTVDHKLNARLDLRTKYEITHKGMPYLRKKTVVPIVESLSELQEVKAGELSLDHWIPFPVVEQHTLDVPVYVNDDYLELLGWYISEGCCDIKVSTSGNLSSGRVAFYLSSDEMEHAERIKELLERSYPPRPEGSRGAGAKVTITSKNETCLCVRYGHCILASQFELDAGKLAVGKHLPEWLLCGSLENLKKTLRGMFLGDGWLRKGRAIMSTISERLAYETLFALERLGIPATLKVIPERTTSNGQFHRCSFEVGSKNRGHVKQLGEMLDIDLLRDGGCDKVTERRPFLGGSYMRRVQSVKVSSFQGKVYNLWVDDDAHEYVTNIGLVSNCHPRDLIALSWLSRELEMGYDWYEAMALTREAQAEWLCELLVKAAGDEPLPFVVAGVAFKPECNISTGSAPLLCAEILRVIYDIDPVLYDPFIPEYPYPQELDGPCAVLIGARHDCLKNLKFAPGSVVVDPHRYLADQPGVRIIRVGKP